LFRASVLEIPRNRVVNEFKWAQFQIRPRLIKADGAFVLTVEKFKKWERPQIRVATVRRFDDLVPAIRRIVRALVPPSARAQFTLKPSQLLCSLEK
jgi:hypothetical protein